MYEELFTQEQILKEVEGFNSDLYIERDMNHNYQELIRALGPSAVKLLTDAELQMTEKPISTTDSRAIRSPQKDKE